MTLLREVTYWESGDGCCACGKYAGYRVANRVPFCYECLVELQYSIAREQRLNEDADDHS